MAGASCFPAFLPPCLKKQGSGKHSVASALPHAAGNLADGLLTAPEFGGDAYKTSLRDEDIVCTRGMPQVENLGFRHDMVSPRPTAIV